MEQYPRGLKALNAFKMKIFEDILSDDLIVRAIANNGVNALDIPVENPGELAYSQVFPYKWKGEDVSDRKEVYLTLSVTALPTLGNDYNHLSIILYVFVHKDIMRIFNGVSYQLRTDYILERLEEIFSQKLGFGIGKLRIAETGETFMSPSIPGAFVELTTVELG